MTTMKIMTKQLRKIIAEEVKKVLTEAGEGDDVFYSKYPEAMESLEKNTYGGQGAAAWELSESTAGAEMYPEDLEKVGLSPETKVLVAVPNVPGEPMLWHAKWGVWMELDGEVVW